MSGDQSQAASHLADFLASERVRSHDRMRRAQLFLDDPTLDLANSARDVLECLRRNAEEVSATTRNSAWDYAMQCTYT